MQMTNKASLKIACLSGVCAFGLMLTACGGSDDSETKTTLPLNVEPVAVNDNITVAKGGTVTSNLAVNDSDADDGLDLSSIEIIAMPVNGAVDVNADGSVDYIHDGGDAVSDLFTYCIKDNSGAVSNTASVAIVVDQPVVTAAVKAGVYDATVVEGADDLEFVVSLSSASTEPASLDYATVDGTAKSGTDYLDANGTLQFSPGEMRKFVTVTVPNNMAAPSGTSKSLQLVLSNPQNIQLTKNVGTGTIIDSHAMSTDAVFVDNWAQTGAFTNAVRCGVECHKADDPAMVFNGEDVSPNVQWQHTVMAHAFNDPYWQAAVEDEVDSFPNLTGFIEDTCTTCHAPIGRTHAHHTGTNLDVDHYYRFDVAISEDHSREGIGCSACHQIEEGNLGTPESFSGGYAIQGDSEDPGYKNMYGPYDSPVGGNMLSQTGHTPVLGAYVAESELCATCHTLYTPTLDPETGSPTGTSFLEQGPYLEWQNSVYAPGQALALQCQDCHMPEPAVGYETKISLAPPSSPIRTTGYGQHTLLGGNAHLLEVLRQYSSELGIADSTLESGFNDQISQTQHFLKSAVTVAVSAPSLVEDNLEFNVEVANNAGHKIPTAYPSRRMWLHVTVIDGDSNIIFESGKPDSRGYISTDDVRLKADCMSAHKLEGFDSNLCYEPHRNQINDQSQVAVYETVIGDVNDNITHTLLQGSRYLKDNRIPPLGFTNSKAATIEMQTIPVGVAGDDDFNCMNPRATEGCGLDTVHYQVNIEGRSGPYAVEVGLLYQATQPAYVDGMHNTGDRVNRFKVMYDAVPPSVEVLAIATQP
jgi:hypothetical protein